MRPRGVSMKLGVMLESGRLFGAMAFSALPTRPKAFGVPGLMEKSSISSLRITPVFGTMSPEPKNKLMVMVAATAIALRVEHRKMRGVLADGRRLDAGQESRSAWPYPGECCCACPAA